VEFDIEEIHIIDFCARNVVFSPLILLDYLAHSASTVQQMVILSTVAKPIRSLLVAPFQPRLIALRAHGCAAASD